MGAFVLRCILLVAVLFVTACSAQPASNKPQSFEDLFTLTDTTTAPICTLSLADLRENMTTQDFDAAKADVFNPKAITAKYANDPVSEIRVQFRRAALNRRLNVSDDKSELAQKYYDKFSEAERVRTSLEEYHDGYHYWMDRIQEQNQFGEPGSPEFNLRFCVMNEKRAELHAASRADILARTARRVTLPAPALVENINHEAPFDDGFSSNLLAKIFNADAVAALSPLERAKMRGDKSFLPYDPKTAKQFWAERDKEIIAAIDYIESHAFPAPADKLSFMTDIDQSLRKFWAENDAKDHFNDLNEYEAFRAEISPRIVQVDESNTEELRKMLEGRNWFRDDKDGRGAANDAWLIAQHADRNPDFQRDVLEMIEAELGAPGVSKTNYAYLYDRVQIRAGDGVDGPKPLQRYATQGRCVGPGTWEPFPFENPEQIDAKRAEVGLGTLDEYKARFKNMCGGSAP